MRKVWTFTIEKEVLEKFKDECWKKRLKMSTVVNELIKKWLEDKSRVVQNNRREK